jgi:hypothetical protein
MAKSARHGDEPEDPFEANYEGGSTSGVLPNVS